MKLARVLRLLVTVSILVLATQPAFAEVKISYPLENSTVSGEVVQITGTGADPKGQLEVSVLTNQWYVQEGKAVINSDGTWSFSPCHLAGTGIYNNHTIRVTVYRNGASVATATVRGVKRR